MTPASPALLALLLPRALAADAYIDAYAWSNSDPTRSGVMGALDLKERCIQLEERYEKCPQDNANPGMRQWCVAATTGDFTGVGSLSEVKDWAVPDPASECQKQATAAPGYTPKAFAASPDMLASGLAGFLTSRALEELTAWGLETVVVQVCSDTLDPNDADDPRIGLLFPRTCAWSASPGSKVLPLPTSILVGDLIPLPRRLAEEALRIVADDPASGDRSAAVDSLTSAAVVARTVELYLEGTSATEALASWARTRPAKLAGELGQASFAGVDGDKLATPVTSVLYLTSETLAVMDPLELIPNPNSAVGFSITSGFDPNTADGRYAAIAFLWTLPRDTGLPDGVKVPVSGDKGEIATVIAKLAPVRGSLARLGSEWLTIVRTPGATGTGVDPSRIGEATLSALVNVAELVGVLFGVEDKVAPLVEVVGAAKELVVAARGDWTEAVVPSIHLVTSTLQATSSELVGSKQWETVLRVSGGVASLAEAESQDDVQAAIEEIAARPGGWKTKRAPETGRRGYATLNSYVGAGIGASFDDAGEPLTTLWPVANLGPELGWRVGNKFVGSAGVQFTLIDVGALAAVQVGASDLPWSSGAPAILSPGVAPVIGIGRTPLSLGVPLTYSPALDHPWRASVMLGVDLVLFP